MKKQRKLKYQGCENHIGLLGKIKLQ